MKLTAGQICDAVDALKAIRERARYIPQMAKFKLSRMLDTLEPFYVPLDAEQGKLVATLGHEVFKDEAKTISQGWTVEPGTPEFDEYVRQWNEIRESRVFDVNVLPITLQALGPDARGIEMDEFQKLGQLVIDLNDENAVMVNPPTVASHQDH